jgi:hypothetical protein
MTQNDNILQELRELKSTLVDIVSQNVYLVPGGYFDNLIETVLTRIKAIEAENSSEELAYLSPLLSKISKNMPYSIPAGYFEGLEEKLMQSVRQRSDYQTVKEELETLSPLLSGLNKQMPYSIPQGYFQNLNRISAITDNKTKIVSINTRKWFRYAAAAIIVGVVSLTGFLLINNKINNESAIPFVKFEKKLDKEIKKTSDKELTEFVQQFTDAGLTGEEKAQINPKEETKDLLKDVPDQELKNFLEETADPDISDSNEMPVN